MVSLKRSEILILLTACVFCIGFVAANHKVGDYGAETDLYLYYSKTAQALHHGEVWIDEFHPPLYGWILGLLTLTGVFPGEFEAGVFLSVLSYLAIVLATFYLARELCKGDLMLSSIAAILVAANPGLADQACRAVVHVFFLALSLWTIYFVIKQKAILAGIFAGLAIWTRCTWILSAVPLLFLRGKSAYRGWVIAALSFLALGLVTHDYHGTWWYTTNKVSFAAGLYNYDTPTNPGLWVTVHANEFKDKSILEIVFYQPRTAAMSVWNHLSEFSGRILTSLMVIPLGILAVFGLRRRFWTTLNNPLVYWSTAAFVVLVVSFWGPQYVIGFVPVLCIAAAAQIRSLNLPRAGNAVARLLVYFTTIHSLIILYISVNEGPVDVRTAALFLKDLPGETVVSRDPRVFYYSGKQPGDMQLTEQGGLITNGDYVFGSAYELKVNDTLKTLVENPEFQKSVRTRNFGSAFIFPTHRAEKLKAQASPTP